jgi:hypothetical protein
MLCLGCTLASPVESACLSSIDNDPLGFAQDVVWNKILKVKSYLQHGIVYV